MISVWYIPLCHPRFQFSCLMVLGFGVCMSCSMRVMVSLMFWVSSSRLVCTCFFVGILFVGFTGFLRI